MKPRRKLARKGLDDATIEENVRAVFARADQNEFSDFADFFDALLLANDNLPHTQLADALGEISGQKVSAQTIRALREGEHLPTYPMLEKLLNYNLLHFTPELIDHNGSQRKTLLRMAAMIEVTPDSTSAYNQKTITDFTHDGRIEGHFGNLMTALCAFQTQGDRAFLQNIPGFSEPHHARDVLANTRNPDEDERHRLYDFCHLTTDQKEAIESAIRGGNIKFGRPGQKTAFAASLSKILDHIKSQGKRAQDVCEHSQDVVGNGIVQGELSSLRHGKYPPTPDKLRAILRGVEWCNGEMLSQVSPEEIDAMIRNAPFPEWKLTATSHDIIAQASAETHTIKDLLRDIREAVDINVMRPVVVGLNGTAASGGINITTQSMLLNWETEGYQYPEPQLVAGLLKRYNHLLQKNGQPEFSEDEQAKVMKFAERDYALWQATEHKDKVRNTIGGRYRLHSLLQGENQAPAGTANAIFNTR